MEKQVSMIKKYHNHTLQTNPRHGENQTPNNNNHKTTRRQSEAISSLFSIKMIAKLERMEMILFQMIAVI